MSEPRFSPEVERWRKYLRQDPTRFLLDADANPSVYLWYLIDLAHRPEDSKAVIEARERVLYSDPVQEIFAAQKPEGYWEPAESLAEPRYTATLWNLALLAELGIPRTSRRARNACEFVLQNFLNDEGRFTRFNSVSSGYLINALAYFNLQSDERVLKAARLWLDIAARIPLGAGRVVVLWAWRNFLDDTEIRKAADVESQKLLDELGQKTDFTLLTFPQFHASDPLFKLRVLAAYNCAHDPRATRLVEHVISKQSESSQWPLEKSLNGSLLTRLEEESDASRWATLNALRVIVKLVLHGQ